MLPDFPRLKERLLRLAWFEHRGHVQADDVVGPIRATPYFEGRGFATGDVDGHVEHTKAELMAFQYEIERSAIIDRGLDALRESLAKAAALQIQAMHEMVLRQFGDALAQCLATARRGRTEGGLVPRTSSQAEGCPAAPFVAFIAERATSARLQHQRLDHRADRGGDPS